MSNPANVQEVLDRFKKRGPESVVYGGCTFMIQKLSAGAVIFSNGFLTAPFLADVIKKWPELTKEEQDKKAEELIKEQDTWGPIVNSILENGCVEPKFSSLNPCPEGSVPVQEIDEDLKIFLASQILKLSNIDKKSSEFFRSSTNGVPDSA